MIPVASRGRTRQMAQDKAQRPSIPHATLPTEGGGVMNAGRLALRAALWRVRISLLSIRRVCDTLRLGMSSAP
jgi:hypothetical protein